MDPRKALVFLGCHAFPETHAFLLSSRGRKECAFVNHSFHVSFAETYDVLLRRSSIIEDIRGMRATGLASLAFFYCDFRDDQKKGLRGLVSSLLVQLCNQADCYCDILSKFYLEHSNGLQHPSDDELIQCLKDVLEVPGQAPVFLILDALDECLDTEIPSPRGDVLKLLGELIESQIPNLRICVTSRPEADIKVVFEPLSSHSVSLHEERGQMEDIENYIKSAVNMDQKNRRWKEEDKQLVIKALTENADGM